ncbi:hypothetical protein OA170_02945, partial [Pelagibacteraceae bacterium]|nr:hypothetical protein [Pelagibacteraceae bacterium]
SKLKKIKIFICCTEQSGENICSNILSRMNIDKYQFDGVCGKRSEKYISNKIYDLSEFKSIGLFEIILSISKYLKMIRRLKNYIIKNDYDLVLTIDSPDFNYNLVNQLRKSNYKNKIIHVVAPTVWAWRPYRARKFANIFDEIFLLFNFEKKYFNFDNLNNTFIGHPIFHIKKRENKSKYKYLSFLPGSRQNEVLKLIKYFSYIEKYISKNNLNYKIFIPTLPHLVSLIKENTKQWKTETIISTDMSKFDEYYQDVYISITCSGTASLEIAKRNIPQIVIYKLNYFTEILIKPFVRVKYANLINIISNQMIIPEVVNSNLNEKKLLNIFLNLFNDRKKQETQINSINMYLNEIVNDFSPYDVSVNRINKLINPSSKAN